MAFTTKGFYWLENPMLFLPFKNMAFTTDEDNVNSGTMLFLPFKRRIKKSP